MNWRGRWGLGEGVAIEASAIAAAAAIGFKLSKDSLFPQSGLPITFHANAGQRPSCAHSPAQNLGVHSN